MGIFRTHKGFFKAVETGDAATVKAYLAHDENWARIEDKKTKRAPLHIAARRGHAGIVQMLLDAGGTGLHGDKDGQTPLHCATLFGDAATIRLLIEKCPSHINSTDHSGRSPFQLAIADDRVDLVKLFLETKKADLAAGTRPALYYAVEKGHINCVATLLAAGADVNAPYTMVDRGDDDYLFRRSLRRPTITKYSPLACACNGNRLNIAKLLLAAGATLQDNEFPVHAAAAHGNVELATELIRHGFSVRALNASQSTVLHAAVTAQNLAPEVKADMVRFLLAQDVAKDATDKSGRTALSYAQQYALTDIVELLQNPPPALAPVTVNPVPVAKPVVAAVARPAPAAAPVAPEKQSGDDDTWTRAGKSGVAHAVVVSALNRRLTEIFNFETRERVTVTENLATGAEAMGPHESFDTVTDQALQKAYNEFRKLGGVADENAVFGTRPFKMLVKP